jgi:hypothetical protein
MDLEQTLQDLGPVVQLASDLVVVYLGKKTMLSIILLEGCKKKFLPQG